MKTKILTALLTASFITPAAFAEEAMPVDQQVLQALIVNSGQITLVSEEGTELQSEFQMPGLIASYLLGGYLSAKENGYLTLGNVSLDCKEGPGARGADQVDCNVTFLNGDFTVSKNGGRFEGPEAESSISFEISAIKTGKNKVRLLGKKFKAFLAG
jgi:hypothetical protein